MLFDLIGFLFVASELAAIALAAERSGGGGNGEDRESVEESRGRGVWYYKQRWSFRFTPWVIILFEK